MKFFRYWFDTIIVHCAAALVVAAAAGCGGAWNGSGKPEPRGSICQPEDEEREDCWIRSEYPDLSDDELYKVKDEEALRRICNAECGRIERLTIAQIPGLEDLRALEGLMEVENELGIWENPNLSSLEGLSAEVNALAIEALPELRSFDGIDEAGMLYLDIRSNPNIESLQGLENVETLRSLNILKNERLRSLKGLEGLTIEPNGRIEIKGNNLRSLKPIRNWNLKWTTEEVCSKLTVDREPRLENLEGLEQIEKLCNLEISNNDSLKRLDGLDGLEEITTFISIRDNPNLPMCVADAFADRVDTSSASYRLRENGGYDHEVCDEGDS